MRKIPFAGIELTYQRVRGYMDTSELPGRQAFDYELLILIIVILSGCTIKMIIITTVVVYLVHVLRIRVS